MDWGSFKDVVSWAFDANIILGVGTLALVSAAGLPLVGPGRALTLGWRSYFKSTHPMSVRSSDVNELKYFLVRMKRGSFITYTGGKGLGKSCLIDTALNRLVGVVKISTKSGAGMHVIIEQVLRKITGIPWEFIRQQNSAHRVLFFYSFLFKRPPIVVIRVPERESGETYAQATDAAKALAEDFGLRIIVDSSLNSIPPMVYKKSLETEISVGPMTRDHIESIPEFEGLIRALKTFHLDDPVWKVLGGSPAKYTKLKEWVNEFLLLTEYAPGPVDFVAEVRAFVLSNLLDALYKDIGNCSQNTKAIVALFREERLRNIPVMQLEARGYSLDYPNKVFQEVRRSHGWYIEPSTAAVSLILSENINDDGAVLAQLEKLFANAKH